MIAAEHTRRREVARRKLSAFAANVRLNKKALDLMEDTERAMLRMTQSYGESVTSSVKETISAKVAELDELRGTLGDLAGMYAESLDEVSECIERVGEVNAPASAVLAERYLAWGRQPELEDIACRLGYSLDWTKKLHAIGLDIAADILGVDA